MKSIVIAFWLATVLNPEVCLGKAADEPVAADSILFKRCIELADEPTFAFPISRKLGVTIKYAFEPTESPETRVFSVLIATKR